MGDSKGAVAGAVLAAVASVARVSMVGSSSAAAGA